MRIPKFKTFHLFLAVLLIALLLACINEQKSVVGHSSTESPDGTWRLDLRLTEFSTLFRSRKTLDASVLHKTNKEWDVSTSIPFDDADAETISNQIPECPIVWSDDSKTVHYWINRELEDWIKIEATDLQHKFQRKLYSTTVTVEKP